MKNNQIKTEKDFLKKTKDIMRNIQSMSLQEVTGFAPTLLFQGFKSRDLPSYNTQDVLGQSDKTLSRSKIEMRGRNIIESSVASGIFGSFIGGFNYIAAEEFNNNLIQSISGSLGVETSTLYTGIVTISGIGLYLYNSVYKNDSATRFREEEQISKYSDDIAAEGCKTYHTVFDRSDAKLYNKSLSVFGGQGAIQKTSLFIVACVSLMTYLPKKIIEKIAKKISQSNDSGNALTNILGKILPMDSIDLLARKNYKKEDTNATKTKVVRDFIARKTKKLQTGYNASDYKAGMDMGNVIDTSYQESLKRNIKRSLIKAISDFESSKKDIMNKRSEFQEDNLEHNNRVLKDIKIIENSGKKAYNIIKKISLLHNKRVEAKFDHYQSISQIAMDYKNKGYIENSNTMVNTIINTKSEIDKISSDYVNNDLKENSIKNANSFFQKSLEDMFDKDEFKSPKSKKNLIKKMLQISNLHGMKYSINVSTKNTNVDVKIKIELDKILKNPQDYDVKNISSALKGYSQIANNQNIKNEVPFWKLVDAFKEHRVEYRGLESDIEEDSYAKLSATTFKI
jgi:hypothetical protein